MQAAYWDLATAVLAILALLTVRVRFLFWPLVWEFNLVGLVDLVLHTAGAVRIDLPSIAGQLGAGHAIPILYVPALFLTHLLALWLLLRPARVPVRPAGAPMSLAATKIARKGMPSDGSVIGGANRFTTAAFAGWRPVNRDAGLNWRDVSKPPDE